MQLEEVASLGRAMSIYWAICEHVPAARVKKYKAKEMDDRVGLFYTKGLAENLDEACCDWKGLLKELIQLNVEPKRTDVEKALERFDGNHDGKLWHPSEEHDLSKRMQSQGIKMMISHIAMKKRILSYFRQYFRSVG